MTFTTCPLESVAPNTLFSHVLFRLFFSSLSSGVSLFFDLFKLSKVVRTSFVSKPTAPEVQDQDEGVEGKEQGSNNDDSSSSLFSVPLPFTTTVTKVQRKLEDKKEEKEGGGEETSTSQEGQLVTVDEKARVYWVVNLEERFSSSKTKRYDEVATTHLFYILAPLVGHSSLSKSLILVYVCTDDGLRHLLPHVPEAQVVLLLLPRHAHLLPLPVRLHPHDSAPVHQLQTQVRGPHELAGCFPFSFCVC